MVSQGVLMIETFIKIVISMTPRAGVLCAGAWPYSENAIFLLLFLSTLGHGSDKLKIYTVHRTMIANVLENYDAAFIPLLIFIYSMMGLLTDMQNDPCWQEVSVESLILRWTLRPVGLLGFFFIQMKGRRDKISKTSVSVFIPTDFYRYMREKFEMNVVLKLRIMTRICCRASPA